MKKNICIIVKSLNDGGAERAAANLSKDLYDTFNTYLIVYDGSDIAYPFKGTLLDLNTRISTNKIKRMLSFIKRCYLIKGLKKQYNIDYSISFMPGANLVNVLSRYKEKIITSQRNTMSIRSNSQIQNSIMRWVAKNSEVTVALSKGVKTDLIQNLNFPDDKVVTIYNSCEKNWLDIDDQSVNNIIQELDPDFKHVITTGRLTYQKGQWHLLKAFSEVAKQNEKVKLIVLGTGEMRVELEELAIQLGIENKVIFLGYVKNYHKLIEHCEIFVLSSLFEGLGNVLLEALAFEIPIIAADCNYGPKEILDPKNNNKTESIHFGEYGVLVPDFGLDRFNKNTIANDKEKILAGAIINLLEDESKRMFYSNRSKERFNDFNPNIIKDEWINLIEKLM